MNYRSVYKKLPPILKSPAYVAVLVALSIRNLTLNGAARYFSMKLGLWFDSLRNKQANDNNNELIGLNLKSGKKLSVRRSTTDLGIFEQIYFFKDVHVNGLELNGLSILDCGAHIGCSTLYFSEMWPDSNIVSIEPASQNYDILCTNTKDNSKISPLHGAIWDSETSLNIANPDADDWTFRMESDSIEADSAEQIQGFTIREVMKYHSIQRIGLLKLDIEGAEKRLFESTDTSWVADVDNMIVELHDNIVPGTEDAFWNMMSNYDYDQRGTNFNVVCLNIREKSETSKV